MQLHLCCGFADIVADVVAGVERPVAVGVAEVRRDEGWSEVVIMLPMNEKPRSIFVEGMVSFFVQCVRKYDQMRLR